MSDISNVLFNETSDLMLILSAEGDIISVNPSFEHICGLKTEDFTSNAKSWKDFVVEEDLPNVFNAIKLCLARRQTKKINIRIKGLHGEILITQGYHVICDNSGKIQNIIVIAQEVISQKKNEESGGLQREQQIHLYQIHKMEAVGKLAGGIAHDFNNILGGILGLASYLQTKAEPGSDMHESLSLIEESAARAAELTGNLISISRKAHFSKKMVSINEVINEVIGQLENTSTKGITINLDLAESLPNIMGDRTQLSVAINNICNNAIEAMDGINGVLKISTVSRHFNNRERAIIPEAPLNPHVCVEISDNGVGMSHYIQQHVFDPFFTTKEKFGRAGFGMAIAFGVITNHGGKMIVNSQPGKGSTFQIYLPICEERQIDIKKEKPISSLVGTETILVIDDEAIIRRMIVSVLENSGYKVLCASSGKEGLELVKKHHVDLVLLDILMPEMDSEETLKAIRAIDNRLPVLLTTGYAEYDQCVNLLEQGVNGILNKPYKNQELLTAIRQAL